MARTKLSDDEVIDQIQAIRALNNGLWMNVVRLAMRVARKDARKLFSEIEKNDRKIYLLTRRLAK